MRQASKRIPESAEKTVRDIRRATRRHHSAEEKIRIVLDGLRGEDSIAELCRKEEINQNLYYRWSKEFLEAGKKRLAGDTAREATSDEVKELKAEARQLKETAKNAKSSGRYSFFVDRPDIARREVAQTESTPVVVDAVVEADARRTLLKCGVGALEDLYAIFVDGEGIADSSEFEYVAVDAGSSVPHEISEIVQGPVPAD